MLARKLTGPGDEFLGVVVRGIEPGQFENFFSSVTLKRAPLLPYSAATGRCWLVTLMLN